jgi:DNA-directed RNA polymerase subunit M/transcription elongation factor TFIIS
MMMMLWSEGAWSAGAAPSKPTEESTEPRCPNCSSVNTKPLSFNADATPYAVYACRACAHVWRLPRPNPA